MTKWTKGTFETQGYMKQGNIAREGYVNGHFAVFKAGKSWAVTHLPSGLGIARWGGSTLAEVKRNVEKFSGFNWAGKNAQEIAEGNGMTARAFFDLVSDLS